MTKVLCVLAACVGAMACATAPQVDTAAEEEAVRQRSSELAAAEAAMDIERVMGYWALDAVAQPSGAPQVEGAQAIRELYGHFLESGGLKEFAGTTTHVEVSASGDLAYEYGVNRMVFAGPTGDLLDIGKYLVVWKKVEGTWLVAALSFTSDAPQPEPVASQ